MRSLETENPDTEINQKRKIAEQARDLFVEASICNPFSLAGQAARIAIRCRELDLSPNILGISLLGHPDLISDIQTKGTRAHSRVNIKPIREEQLRDTIETDFAFAQDLMILDKERWESLFLPFQHKPPTRAEDENLYVEGRKLIALEMLRTSMMNESTEDPNR